MVKHAEAGCSVLVCGKIRQQGGMLWQEASCCARSERIEWAERKKQADKIGAGEVFGRRGALAKRAAKQGQHRVPAGGSLLPQAVVLLNVGCVPAGPAARGTTQ